MRAALPLFVAAAALVAPDVTAQCVSNSPGAGVTSASTVNFNVQGALLSPSQVQAGVNMWSTCGNYGTGFPSMTVNGNAAVNITIQLIAGANPNANGGCGVSYWSRNSGGSLTGGTINLFDADAFGRDCEPTRAETIAHEIGHALGMADASASCLPDIMGPNNMQPGSRSVLSQDCTDVDGNWVTPQETPPSPNPGSGGTTTTNEGWWCASYCDPLVLDLNGDGVTTTGVDDPVWFDIDGDGVRQHVTWTNARTGEAFLWIDLNHKNRVDDGSELFGVGTVLPDGRRARDGFEALAMYDTPAYGGNGDGVIDQNDAVWNQLRVWIDTNHDGISEPGETGPLHEYGIDSIPLGAYAVNSVDPAGNLHLRRAVYSRRSTDAGRTTTRYFQIDEIAFRVVP